MMRKEVWQMHPEYLPKIILMIGTLYVIRLLPFLFIRGEIKNRFFKSFLHYVPYVTLAVMTFPAIVLATDHMASGIAALIVGLIVAWFSGNLFITASCCCAAVLVTSLFV